MIRTAILGFILVVTTAASAEAGYPFGGYGFGFSNNGFWPGVGGFGYGQGFGYVPPPPYYAVHPPVYYSPTIIRRPYGQSPFAMLPAIEPTRMASAPDASLMQPAPGPQLIINPFVPGAANWSPPSTAGEALPVPTRQPAAPVPPPPVPLPPAPMQ